jgi:hypothetical protein
MLSPGHLPRSVIVAGSVELVTGRKLPTTFRLPGGAAVLNPHLDDPIGAAAELLAAEVGAVERILQDHVPTGDGRSCIVCSRSQHGSHTWPCVMATIAHATALLVAQSIPVAGR